ncbi:hypothetical protein [Dyadobacter sp. CY347]|uniref:hypothetical protein n=1 Tax=Dyadobacter sp. CY347 TaxID=2909336 RepID=UPI001F178699|nr:hypothetical protein [Dyadobacter sp. CY347]MCF2489597.1 hypothetical protein [Dyadobacter sp. CY347]
MKSFKSLTFFILMIGSNACEIYTPYRNAGMSWGYFEANMSGTEWSKLYDNAYQSVYAGISENTDSLCSRKTAYMFSNSFDSNGYKQQVLFFDQIPLSQGKYLLTSEENESCIDNGKVRARLDSEIYDDQPGDTFKILPKSESYLQINSLNMATGEIFGEFNFTMVVCGVKDDSNLPDTLRLTNGKFHTKILVHPKRKRHL